MAFKAHLDVPISMLEEPGFCVWRTVAQILGRGDIPGIVGQTPDSKKILPIRHDNAAVLFPLQMMEPHNTDDDV